MKIETYIAIPSKRLNTQEHMTAWFELFYITLIPSTSAFFLGLTRHPLFIFPILLPFVIRLRLTKGQTKVYKQNIKDHIPK